VAGKGKGKRDKGKTYKAPEKKINLDIYKSGVNLQGRNS
jgi:hypothetical protein